jgi:SAM-dependent methyltransferase
MGHERRLYSPEFYRKLSQTRRSAEAILPIVFEFVQPASIVDIGCGTGEWLGAAKQLGVSEILGVDGAWVLDSEPVIPRDNFLAHDIRLPLTLERKFDLVISLEVAEHLPESNARQFVQTLCAAGEVALFSAAIPGQGGRNHVNEQWPSYWAQIFSALGLSCYDLVRPRIWENPNVAWYYAQNVLLFAREGRLKTANSPGAPLSLVHPTAWTAQTASANSPGKLLERLPKAIMRRFVGK